MRVEIVASSRSSRPSIDEIPGDEKQKEKRQGSVNQSRLFTLRHRVRAETVSLILLETRHLLPERLKLRLIRPARRAPPVLGQILKLRPRGDGIEIIPNLGPVFVHAALALPVALTDDGESFLELGILPIQRPLPSSRATERVRIALFVITPLTRARDDGRALDAPMIRRHHR